MVIEESDFRMELVQNSLWNLELLQTVKPRGKPERQEFQLEGYGLSIYNCINKIIHYRISKNKDIITLKEFLFLYKQELQTIKKLINYEEEK